jgi:hypothetical protein
MSLSCSPIVLLSKVCRLFGNKGLPFTKVCKTSSEIQVDRLEETYLQLQNTPSINHQHFPGLRDRPVGVGRVLSCLQTVEVPEMASTGKRNPRVTVSFTPEELALLNGRSGNQASAYLRALALNDIGSDDITCRQFYALGMTLNEALAVLIDEVEGQVPDKCTHQLQALREAVKALQRQAYMGQMDVSEILRQLHDAVGGNRLAQLEEPKRLAVDLRALQDFGQIF